MVPVRLLYVHPKSHHSLGGDSSSAAASGRTEKSTGTAAAGAFAFALVDDARAAWLLTVEPFAESGDSGARPAPIDERRLARTARFSLNGAATTTVGGASGALGGAGGAAFKRERALSISGVGGAGASAAAGAAALVNLTPCRSASVMPRPEGNSSQRAVGA